MRERQECVCGEKIVTPIYSKGAYPYCSKECMQDATWADDMEDGMR